MRCFGRILLAGLLSFSGALIAQDAEDWVGDWYFAEEGDPFNDATRVTLLVIVTEQYNWGLESNRSLSNAM